MGGNGHDVEAVDFFEFLNFCESGSCHSCEFFVLSEEILVGDGGEGLVFLLYGDVFFCFESLMESVGIPPTFHFSACEFVDNDDVVIFDDVVVVFSEEMESTKRLGDVVYEGHVLRVEKS